jgi:acyl-CoA thioesterase
MFEQVDLRLGPEVGWPHGVRRGRAETAGWIRFSDRRPLDALSLVFFADSFPPAVFDVVPRSWVPTLELTVHVRHRPAGEWLRGAFRTTAMAGGYLDEEGELWDEDGTLVAMSRQLARYRRPPGDASLG